MDVAGLAIGIVGLYTACRDCYDFFTTVNAAQAESSAHLQKLIKRYGFQLQTTQAIQDGSQPTQNGQLIIPDAKIEDVEPVLLEVRNRLSMLNKLKWALKDKEKFKKLIADLRSHSENLYRLCPENAFESMNIYLTMECLARQESPDGLKWTSTLATENANIDKESLVRQGYELLASTATLKASVNKNRDKKEANDKSLASIDEIKPEMRYLGKGLALFEEQVVYVEMRDYRGPPLDFTEEQKQRLKHRRKRERFLSSLPSHRNLDLSHMDQYSSSDDDEPIERVRPADPKLWALIRNFFDTFHGANMMKNVYGLDIVGMIDHTEGDDKGHCSILYRLPGTIGVQSRERPAENLKLRAPVTLQSLLGTREQKGIRSMLGARFELARKLVRAVCLLHSSGWLHKNIRAESVMFFPEHVNTPQEDRYEVKIEIDVSKPSLMGYIFSRPDDITIQTNPPSELDFDFSPQTPPESNATGLWHNTYGDTPSKHRKRTPRSASIYGRDMRGKVTSSDEAKETIISGFTLDYYQHPAKHADPKRLYRHAYDVYSLGVLLIEVGLWKNLKSELDLDWDEEDHYERRRKICRRYLDRLRWECGDIYADVVLSCLMIDSSDDEVAKASERELCGRIVADLENCQA
ncbi:hypothetical protein FNAPI_12837 [Fusarium napiforme]|uniref:Prion-inhibition and propagation HeLo domain-containing protein n=1 Tax=Fusarium napiforme TaxID=42672 RepID=A0A8H5MJX5_9HYPO|nr:hypothetical protein FNAPI_12837 [Fusarium napiforme]